MTLCRRYIVKSAFWGSGACDGDLGVFVHLPLAEHKSVGRVKLLNVVQNFNRKVGWLCLCASVFISSTAGQTAHALSSGATHSSYDTYAASTPAAQTEVAAAQKLFSNGEYKDAARKLQSAVKIEPHNSGLLDDLGTIYERMAEGSAFPSLDQRRAAGLFRRSMAADAKDPRPLQHLISLLLDPPNRCRVDLSEVPKLIQRLSQIDPVAAREASQNLEWASGEPSSLAEKLTCAPHQAAALVHKMLP